MAAVAWSCPFEVWQRRHLGVAAATRSSAKEPRQLIGQPPAHRRLADADATVEDKSFEGAPGDLVAPLVGDDCRRLGQHPAVRAANDVVLSSCGPIRAGLANERPKLRSRRSRPIKVDVAISHSRSLKHTCGTSGLRPDVPHFSDFYRNSSGYLARTSAASSREVVATLGSVEPLVGRQASIDHARVVEPRVVGDHRVKPRRPAVVQNLVRVFGSQRVPIAQITSWMSVGSMSSSTTTIQRLM